MLDGELKQLNATGKYVRKKAEVITRNFVAKRVVG